MFLARHFRLHAFSEFFYKVSHYEAAVLALCIEVIAGAVLKPFAF
ncbi:hypothetical protein SPWS13_0573 [Shewanella putrefaciens]|nr:hypothetical protein SPWS13_0573 [Shewanella putrefaciens]